VTIRINENILYTFYLADNEKYLKDSPTTFLLSGIYQYCQQQKIKFLDLGIATEKGVLNEGLARFKQSLGAKISKKKTYFLLF
jgi:lipid II:glycine glycyltransferase (peptidoglycan interpeptide bridge formation enzyme)